MKILRNTLTLADVIRCAFLVLVLARKSKRFKIGKTGMTLSARRLEPDYKDEFPRIICLYSSRSRKNVSLLEAKLINAFYHHPRSANEKDGFESINDQLARRAKVFHVYMVCK